jgi:hypothetical protein
VDGLPVVTVVSPDGLKTGNISQPDWRSAVATLYLILLIVAAVCFGLASFGAVVHPRLSLLALGLLAWVLVPLIQQARHL